jgi:hypothetical protein
MKRYRVTLRGCKRGAIGIWYNVATWEGNAPSAPHARVDALAWGYAHGYDHLSTPSTAELQGLLCVFCGAEAVVPLTEAELDRTDTSDGTTHVCHPELGGCNHGFEKMP